MALVKLEDRFGRLKHINTDNITYLTPSISTLCMSKNGEFYDGIFKAPSCGNPTTIVHFTGNDEIVVQLPLQEVADLLEVNMRDKPTIFAERSGRQGNARRPGPGRGAP